MVFMGNILYMYEFPKVAEYCLQLDQILTSIDQNAKKKLIIIIQNGTRLRFKSSH